MKKLSVLFTILFSLIVVGCGSEETRIEFSTNHIVMEVYSTYKIKYKTYGKVTDLYFEVENENIVTIDNEILTSHNPGDTKLICIYNQSEKVEIDIKVLNEVQDVLEIGDPRLNELNYYQLENKISNFSENVEKSNHLTIDMKIKFDDEEVSQTLKAMEDPLYIEIITQDYTNVIRQEDNKVFEYYIRENKKCSRSYLGMIGNSEDYNDFEDVDNSSDILETTFNGEKCNVEYVNNTYIIRCYYSDAINEESKNAIKETYASLGIDVSILMNAILTMKYVVKDDKIYMSVSTVIKSKDLNEPLKMEIIYEIELKEFIPLDMLNGDYVFTNAKNFDEVLGIYGFDHKIDLDNSNPVYLKVNVEKGVIISHTRDIGFELYDMNRQLVNESFGGSDRSILPYISVPEKGTYYLVIINKYGIKESIDLEFHKYNTVYTDKEVDLQSVHSHQGVIEGEHDFEKFIYNNKDTQTLKLRIENKGTTTIKLFNKRNWDGQTIEKIYPNSFKYINLYKGENEIYLCEEFLTYQQNKGYEYNFNTKIMYLPFDGEVIEKDIPDKINLLSFEKIIYHTYLKKGMYSIKNTEARSEFHEIIISNENGIKLDANLIEYSSYEKELSYYFTISEDGYYYVGIRNHISSSIELSFTKYEFETVVDKNNPTMIEPINGLTIDGHLESTQDFEYYRISNNTQKTKIFKLINENESPIYMFLSQKNNSNVEKIDVQSNRETFITLKPGENNLLIAHKNYSSNSNLTEDYKIKFEEIINYNVNDRYSSDIKEITQEFSEEYCIVGKSLPPAYYVLNLQEKGVVSFEYEDVIGKSSMYFNVVIQDENYRIINKDEIMDPGKYYVKFYSNSSNITAANVKYTLNTISDKDVYVTLENIEDKANNIYNEKLTDEQVVKYHFTLEEKTTIYYDAYYVNIYHEDGTLAAIIPDFSFANNKLYVDLEPGNYYFTTPNLEGETSQSKNKIFIGIKSIERDAPQDYNNMFEMGINEQYQFSKDYSNDIEYVKVNIESADDYTFLVSNGLGYLYNENFELVDKFDRSSATKINLSEGIYYLVAVYPTTSNVSIKIKISN